MMISGASIVKSLHLPFKTKRMTPHFRYCCQVMTGLRYELVWNEVCRVYKDMLQSERWLEQSVIYVPDMSRYTTQVCSSF